MAWSSVMSTMSRKLLTSSRQTVWRAKWLYMLGIQLLMCVLRAVQGSCVYSVVFKQSLGCTFARAQGIRAGIRWVFLKSIRISKFSTFVVVLFNVRIFKGKLGLLSDLFSFLLFALFSLAYSFKPQDQSISLSWSLPDCRVAPTEILEVSAAAADQAHSLVLQEGSRAGDGTLLCLPLAECQNPSRYRFLRIPGRSSHIWLLGAPQSRIPNKNPLSGLRISPERSPLAC